MSINAVSNYNSLDYQNWVDNATAEANKLEESLIAKETTSVGSTVDADDSGSTKYCRCSKESYCNSSKEICQPIQ